jgi:hypothetical protein
MDSFSFRLEDHEPEQVSVFGENKQRLTFSLGQADQAVDSIKPVPHAETKTGKIAIPASQQVNSTKGCLTAHDGPTKVLLSSKDGKTENIVTEQLCDRKINNNLAGSLGCKNVPQETIAKLNTSTVQNNCDSRDHEDDEKDDADIKAPLHESATLPLSRSQINSRVMESKSEPSPTQVTSGQALAPVLKAKETSQKTTALVSKSVNQGNSPSKSAVPLNVEKSKVVSLKSLIQRRKIDLKNQTCADKCDKQNTRASESGE